jgi:hypothetical protein
MNAEQFKQTLRQFIRREPFRPFVVELTDGRVVEVDRPPVLGGGGASFLTGAYDLVEFASADVRAIREAAPETAP